MTIATAWMVAGLVSAQVAVISLAEGMILGANGAFSRDSRMESASFVLFVAGLFCIAASTYCFYIAGTMAGAQ